MEVFGNEDEITSAMLQSINRCRLHMQVTTLANILTGSGNKFMGHALQCRKDENIPHYFQWAVQPRPNNRIRGIWRKALKVAFPICHCIRRLHYRLGTWLENYDDWNWFFHLGTELLYHRRNNATWRVL